MAGRIKRRFLAGIALLAVAAVVQSVAEVVQMHETRAEGGLVWMRQLPFVDVPAGGEITAALGALHVMLP